jgi:hypothetical protein
MIPIDGTPVLGYISLAPGSLGPTAFSLFTVKGQAAYTLAANERVYITNISISTNDTAVPLITIDTGGPTPTNVLRAYMPASMQAVQESIAVGAAPCIFGVVPRATASAITAAKTVEITIAGLVSRT